MSIENEDRKEIKEGETVLFRAGDYHLDITRYKDQITVKYMGDPTKSPPLEVEMAADSEYQKHHAALASFRPRQPRTGHKAKMDSSL